VATAEVARPLAALALAAAESPLTPSAIEIESPSPRLLIRVETTATAAISHAAAARELCTSRGLESAIVEGDAESSIWREHENRLTPGDGTLVKLAVLPTQVVDVVEHIERVASRCGLDARIGGRAALGVLDVLFDGSALRSLDGPSGDEAQRHADAVEELRRNAWARGGSAVIVSAAPAVKALVDPWGDIGDGLPLMRAVKARFDPKGILSPGRGPGGI
jgi:glycolate oxidase FAD binding subunit